MECACTGVDDSMIIYTTNPIENYNIMAFVTSKTGINKAAFKIRNIDEIPKNEAGKTLYKELEV